MKKTLLILAAFFLIAAAPSFADSNVCVTGNISTHTILKYNSTGSIIADVVFNETCPFNCDSLSGNCINSVRSNDVNMAVIIGSSILLFVLFFISGKISGSVPIKLAGKPTIAIEVLQPFFLVLAFIYSLFHVALMIDMARANTLITIANMLGLVYTALGFVLTFLVFYFFISFIYNLLIAPLKKGPSK